jgi:hypothetical protein
MQAIRIETTIEHDGELTLDNLPVHAGENVEIIILLNPKVSLNRNRYSLHGLPVVYNEPFDSVAENEWDALK